MRKLTEEERRRIRELQEMGISDAKISKMLGIPYSTVHYQRPEVREREREHMRKYYQRSEVKEKRREYMRKYREECHEGCEPEFQEFQTFLKENKVIYKKIYLNNIYFAILKYLCLNKKYGLTFRQLERKITGYKRNIKGPLRKLANKGIVERRNKRYLLKENLCYLFDEEDF